PQGNLGNKIRRCYQRCDSINQNNGVASPTNQSFTINNPHFAEQIQHQWQLKADAKCQYQLNHQPQILTDTGFQLHWNSGFSHTGFKAQEKLPGQWKYQVISQRRTSQKQYGS